MAGSDDTDDFSSEISNPASKAEALRGVELQAIRLRAGLANEHDLWNAANVALDAGIYSAGLAAVVFFEERRLVDFSDPFLQSAEELGVLAAEDEESIIRYLLIRYLGDVVSGGLTPAEGARLVVNEIDHHFRLYDRTKKYAGDSHGLEHIIGLYYAYDDVDKRRFAEVDRLLIEACRDWLIREGAAV